MSLTEDIHSELVSRRVSLRKVHLATGLDRATVKRFIETKKAHSDTLDDIAEFLGAKVVFGRPAEKLVRIK